MSADRQEVIESRQRQRGMSDPQPQENKREETIRYVAETAVLMVEAFRERGFSQDLAIMLTSQVLPKLL